MTISARYDEVGGILQKKRFESFEGLAVRGYRIRPGTNAMPFKPFRHVLS